MRSLSAQNLGRMRSSALNLYLSSFGGDQNSKLSLALRLIKRFQKLRGMSAHSLRRVVPTPRRTAEPAEQRMRTHVSALVRRGQKLGPCGV